jgi:hypothetical protein
MTNQSQQSSLSREQVQDAVFRAAGWMGETCHWQHLQGSHDEIFHHKLADLLLASQQQAHAQQVQQLQQRVNDLQEAVMISCAALAASVSLLQRTPRAKQAAPSNKMFDQMLLDYERALEQARALYNNSHPQG